MKPQPLYRVIASTLEARANCIAHGATHVYGRKSHDSILRDIEKNLLPSGAGIDNGCKLEMPDAYDGTFSLTFSYHHMDENGYYCGWSNWTATVRPSLTSEIVLDLESDLETDEDCITDYLYEELDYCLSRFVEWDQERKAYRFAPEPSAVHAAGIIAGADSSYYSYTVKLCSPIDSAEELKAALLAVLKPEKGCGLSVVGPLSDEDLRIFDVPPVHTADAAESFAGE